MFQRFQVVPEVLRLVGDPSVLLSLPSDTCAIQQPEECERPPVSLTAAPLPEPLVCHARPATRVLLNLDLVGNRASSWTFPVVQLESDRPVRSLSVQTRKAAPAAGVAGILDAQPESIGQKPECIEQGALADSVLTDHRRHRRERRTITLMPQPTQGDFLEYLEVLHPESFDPRHHQVPMCSPKRGRL